MILILSHNIYKLNFCETFFTEYNSEAFYTFISKLLKDIAQSIIYTDFFELDQITKFTIYFRTILKFLNHTQFKNNKNI